MSAVYIDGDACPVKAEAERVATRNGLTMFVVSNGGLRPSPNPMVQHVIVAEGADEADKWIADRCGPGDVVVTGDIPLAAKCVASGARVLRHNGDAARGGWLSDRTLPTDVACVRPAICLCQ